MANTKSRAAFRGTPEQKAKLMEVLSDIKERKGALMVALQRAQGIYGYLPIEVQKMIAEGLDIRLEEVYGVVTFYSQFTVNPKGRFQVSCCLGTACYVKGAGDILSKITDELKISSGECTGDGLFSIDACRCIGACGLAPVMTVNDDVYGRLTAADVPGILKKYKDQA